MRGSGGRGSAGGLARGPRPQAGADWAGRPPLRDSRNENAKVAIGANLLGPGACGAAGVTGRRARLGAARRPPRLGAATGGGGKEG